MSIEKRLPLALLVLFIVLFGWNLVFPPPPPAPPIEPATTEPSSSEAAGEAPSETAGEAPSAAEPGAAEAQGQPGPPREAEPWRSEPIELGTPGEPGHYFAIFDSAGGSLLELRIGGFWIERDLDAEERSRLENRSPLLVPVRYLDQASGRVRTKGSLTLASTPSSRGLVPDDLESVNWFHEVLPDGVRFTLPTEAGVTLVKEIRAVPGTSHLAVTLGIENESAAQHAGRAARFVLTAAEAIPPAGEDRFYVEPKAVAGRVKGDLAKKERDLKGKERTGQLAGEGSAHETSIEYLGGHNKYFAVLLRAADEASRPTLRAANWRAVFDGDWVAAHPEEAREGFRYVAADAVLELTVPPVGRTATSEYVLFAGPKSRDYFSPGDQEFEEILDSDLGFFDGIARLILRFLRFLHGILGNWGTAIIVLTLCVRIVLFPLNRRMQSSMARHATKMKRIQPRIEAVKQRYKDDPKKLREEQAKIIQQEGAIPPLGGCLPLFLQIPIFFGLFSALRAAFDLRQQPFVGWIKDLAQPDQLMRLDLDLYFFRLEYLNLLPILMVVLWIGQQKVMPRPTDPQALQMHKIMMWMPILFGLFLYDYAAGLSLYMITTSLFGIAEFTIIRRIWPLDDKERPRKQGGFLAKLAKLQEQAQEQQRQRQKQLSKSQGQKPQRPPPKRGKSGSGKR